MSAEWMPFTELLSKIIDNRGRTCPVGTVGLPLIATNCIDRSNLYPAYDTTRFVSDETYKTWFRGHPLPGDILFVCKGSPGRTNWVPDPVDFCIAQDMVAVRADSSKIYPKYLFAALRSSVVQSQIDNMHVGTMIPHFKKGDFDKLRIPILSCYAQEFIGDLYFKTSERIALLRETNATLEAIAQALFKSWFVDFDPVRAKQEGREPEGMDAGTAALFPDSFEESELGLVPRGWKAKPLSDVLKSKIKQVGGVVVPEYSSTNFGLQLRSEIFKKKLSGSISKNKLIHQGDLVFGLSRQILNFGLMQDLVGCVSPAYKVFTVDKNMISIYLLERIMRFHAGYFFNAISASSREGQSISSENLGHLKFVQFPIEVQNAFHAIIEPLRNRKEVIESQTQTLASIRDTLLPRLISGQLRLPEAEAIIGEAIA